MEATIISSASPASTSTPLKPWLDASRRSKEEVSFEVIVSSPPPPRKSPHKPETPMITVTCGEGESTSFSVPEPVAKCSGLIRSIMDSSGNFIEQQTRKVFLADIEPHILADVIHFLSKDYEENFAFAQSVGERSEKAFSNYPLKRVPFLFEMKPDSVMDMLAAAHYLQIPALGYYAVSMLAEYATDIPSFEGLSPEVVQDVCNRCKPDILRILEQRNMFADFPSVNRMNVWKGYCEKKKWGDLVATKQRERASREAAYLTDTNNNNNSSRGFEIDWRRGYAEISIEHMLTKVGTRYLKTEDFLSFASLFGEVVENVRVDATAFAAAEIKIDNFLGEYFPKLKFVEFLGNLDPFKAQIATILRNSVNLRGIRVSTCNINDRFLQEIAPALAKCKLWELDLSQNFVTQAGVQILAEHVLPFVGLKYLSLSGNSINLEGFRILGDAFRNSEYKGIYAVDVSDCRISLPKHDVFQSTHFAAEVKVLDLSGNLFSRHVRYFWQYLYAKNTTLAELNLSRTGLIDGGLTKLLPCALTIPSLQCLNLSENSIHDAPIGLLAMVLQDPNCHLKKLDLSGNTFGDDGAQRLAEGIRINTSLVELSLSRLSITAVGIRAIDLAISRNPASALKFVYMLNSSNNNNLAQLITRDVIICSPLPTYANFQFRWGAN